MSDPNEDFAMPPPPPPPQPRPPAVTTTNSNEASASSTPEPIPGMCNANPSPTVSESSRKKVWTQQEDDLLRALVQRHGERAWSRIADELKAINASNDLPQRIGKQCRDRWCNHLSPDLDKQKWTPEEDAKLFAAVANLGNQWAEIARTVLPGRSDLSIKNRYYSRMRRENRKLEIQASSIAAAAAAASANPQQESRSSLHFLNSSNANMSVKPSSTLFQKPPAKKTPALAGEAILPSQQQPQLVASAPLAFSAPISSSSSSPLFKSIMPPPLPNNASSQAAAAPGATTAAATTKSLMMMELNEYMMPSPSSGPSLFSTAFGTGAASPPTSSFPAPFGSSSSGNNNSGSGAVHLTLNHMFSPFSSPNPSPPHSPSSHNRLLPSRPTSRPVSPNTVMGAINQHFQNQQNAGGFASLSFPAQPPQSQSSMQPPSLSGGAGGHSPLPDFDIYSTTLTSSSSTGMLSHQNQQQQQQQLHQHATLFHHMGGSGFRLSPPASSASTPSTNRPPQYFSSSSIATAAAAAAQQQQQQQQQQQVGGNNASSFFPNMSSRVVGGIELLPHSHHYRNTTAAVAPGSSNAPQQQQQGAVVIPPPPPFLSQSTTTTTMTTTRLAMGFDHQPPPQPPPPMAKRARKSSSARTKRTGSVEDDFTTAPTSAAAAAAAAAGLNVGRWTAEEHELFERALELHGTQDWSKITEFVGTRTIVQIRSHAQKYFLKMGYTPKSGTGPSLAMGRPAVDAQRTIPSIGVGIPSIQQQEEEEEEEDHEQPPLPDDDEDEG